MYLLEIIMVKESGGSKTTVRFRDAGNGQFLKESQAKRRSHK